MKNELSERLFRFAIHVIRFLRAINDNSTEFRVIRYQLTKSSTTSGSNYEEAQAASSKADFRNKVDISLKEMRELNYWIRIIDELEFGSKENYRFILKESDELKRILGAISSKLDKGIKS